MKLFGRNNKENIDEIRSEWSTPLWDFHTHIVPDVDDGSPDIDVSIEMIESEISMGVTDIMLTPHFLSGRSDWDELKEGYEELKKACEERGLEIRLHMGAELYYTEELSEELRKNDMSLAGTDFVLLELATDISYSYMTHAIRSVRQAGKKPILAHVERYDCLFDDEDRFDELHSMGVYMQVNARTLTSRGGAKMFIQLIKDDIVQFIGSDCHSIEWRPPNLDDALGVLISKLGREETERLLDAGRILGI